MRTIAALLSLLLAAPVLGADLRTDLASADAALAANDYANAYQAYARHAATNPLAQFNLGLFAQQGWGRPADAVAACAWFAQAAHGHIPAAMQFLGDCLVAGTGRAVDGQAALQWYAQAAASGIATAHCSAGELFINGAIVPRDVARGLALCAAAARQESLPAMLTLAEYYRTHAQAPLARYWYAQAAERHHGAAQWRLCTMLAEGEGGAAAPAQARFWCEQAAMAGHVPAYLATAILYANAPLDPATGAMEPNDLARVYMWNRAARASTSNPDQLAVIARIDAMVLVVMPAQWQADLDRRVAGHLANNFQY